MTGLEPMRPPLVVVNPTAARLVHEARRETLGRDLGRALVTRYGVEPDWAPATADGAAAALADVAGRPLVVVAGGDGTVRGAAESLVGHDVPLAIVPGGTGNVLAGTLGIRGSRGAIAAIRAGEERRIDLGHVRWGEPGTSAGGAATRSAGTSGTTGSAGTTAGTTGTTGAPVVHERTFTVACGMGFDARVMALAEHEWKRRLRFGAYVGAALREAVRLEAARFHIEADGDVIDIEGLVVLIANCGDLIPGRLGVRQPLDPSDGRLDLIVIGGRGIVEGLRGAVEVLVRTGELDGSVIRRAVRQVRVTADPPQPTQTDGDVHPPGWLEASVRPGALRVLVPPRRERQARSAGSDVL
jgi:diacylglycerol kinase family enzyme